MATIELSKGEIARFISGIQESTKNKDMSPMLVQVLDIMEDYKSSPPAILFVYLWRDFRLSDGITSCRAIFKMGELDILNDIKQYDVVILSISKIAYINGM